VRVWMHGVLCDCTLQDDIVAYFNVIVDHIVFKNETILANADVSPNKGFRARIRDKTLSFFFASQNRALLRDLA
jgi:hypothetical protein